MSFRKIGLVVALFASALAFTATSALASGPQIPRAGTGAPTTGAFTPSDASTLDEIFGQENEAGPQAYNGIIDRSLSTGVGNGVSVNSGKKAKSNPELKTSFQGLNHYQQRYSRGGNQFSLEPPDQGLCVGNGYVVEATNDVFNVYNTSGQSVLPDNTSTNIVSGFPRNVNHAVDLNSFYGYAPAITRSTGVRGPFGRADDQAGIAVGYAKIGSAGRGFSSWLMAERSFGMPVIVPAASAGSARAVAIPATRLPPGDGMTEPSLAEKVLELHRALTNNRISHAFGGALALAYYAEPRGTVDVDLNVFLSPSQHARVERALAPLGVNPSRNLQAVVRDGQVRVRWGRTPIDIFYAYDPFHAAMRRAAREVSFGDATILVLSPEHLAVCKALFNRPRDWVDIESLLATLTSFDVRVALHWMRRFVGRDDARTRHEFLTLTNARGLT